MLISKFFRCNSCRPSRMCCRQRTCTMLKSFRCNTYKKAGGGGVQRVHCFGVPQLAAAIPSSGASFNARERCAARDYRPRRVGCRMKLSTLLGKSPKDSVPTTVKPKKKYTETEKR